MANIGQLAAFGLQAVTCLPHPTFPLGQVAFGSLRVGTLCAPLSALRLGRPFASPGQQLGELFVLGYPFGMAAVGLLVCLLGADLGAQLMQLPHELVGGHLRITRAQRLVHCRGLGADPLGGFGDVIEAAPQVGRVGSDPRGVVLMTMHKSKGRSSTV